MIERKLRFFLQIKRVVSEVKKICVDLFQITNIGTKKSELKELNLISKRDINRREIDI